jgi:hypothetical protein
MREDLRKVLPRVWEICTSPASKPSDVIAAAAFLARYGLGEANSLNVQADAGELPDLRVVIELPDGTQVDEGARLRGPLVQRELPASRAREADEVEGDDDQEDEVEPSVPEVEVGALRVTNRGPDGSAVIEPAKLDLAEPLDAEVEEPEPRKPAEVKREEEVPFYTTSGVRRLPASMFGRMK